MSQITVTIEGVEMEVEYVYQPFEKQTLEHPGYPECFEIEEVFIGGVEVSELILPFYFDRIIEAITSI